MNKKLHFLLEPQACRRCAQAIKQELRSIPEVRGIEIDFLDSIVEVEILPEADITSQITSVLNRLGYFLTDGRYRKIATSCETTD